MRILDLFCKAGGAGKGYADAGFEVMGVDIAPQKRYPYQFVQMDAVTFLKEWAYPLWMSNFFDAIHASPPCQRYSTMTARHGQEQVESHPDLVAPIRELLIATGLPYIIENVPGAPLANPVTLCGSMFGLKVRRHRNFETNFPVEQPACRHKEQGAVVGVYGHSGGTSKRDGLTFGGVDTWRDAMGIDWMVGDELAEAVPPAYTEYMGRALLARREVAA